MKEAPVQDHELRELTVRVVSTLKTCTGCARKQPVVPLVLEHHAFAGRLPHDAGPEVAAADPFVVTQWRSPPGWSTLRYCDPEGTASHANGDYCADCTPQIEVVVPKPSW